MTKFEKERLNFVKKSLRRASLKWPYRNKAIQAATPERGQRICEDCGKKFHYKQTELDHKDPVENIKTGFVSLDNYVERLLPDVSGWAVLCLKCHDNKTFLEDQMRDYYNAKRKPVKSALVDKAVKKALKKILK